MHGSTSLVLAILAAPLAVDNDCATLTDSGGCTVPEIALNKCRAACHSLLRRNLTEDQHGNCWYWSTSGECTANAAYMRHTCPRSCRKLIAASESAEAAEAFECPLEHDQAGEETSCATAARRGQCRHGSHRFGDAELARCPYTCLVLDPPSASRTFTRPPVRSSPLIDVQVPRHRPGGCSHVGVRRPLLAANCPYPNDDAETDGAATATAIATAATVATTASSPLTRRPWHYRRLHCPTGLPGGSARTDLTPRLLAATSSASPATPALAPLPREARGPLLLSSLPRVRVATLLASPRVRLLHGFLDVAEVSMQLLKPVDYPHASCACSPALL